MVFISHYKSYRAFFLISVGPWGVFAVSERSQVSRLKDILSQADILKDDHVQNEVIWNEEQFPQVDAPQPLTNTAFLSDSLYSEVSSILYYLDDYHGFDALESWFSQDLDSLLAVVNQDKLRWQHVQEPQLYLQTMGVRYPAGPGDPSSGFHYFEGDLSQSVTTVAGYDYLIAFSIEGDGVKEFKLNGDLYKLQIDKSREELLLSNGQEKRKIPLAALMRELLEDVRHDESQKTGAIPPSKLQYVDEQDARLKVDLQQINFQTTTDKKFQLAFLSGFLLINEDLQEDLSNFMQ